jgi:phosphoglycerate kinase
LPTIDYIIKNNGTIILATHIGRPKVFDPALSTQHLMPWFRKKGYSIAFVQTPEEAALKSNKPQCPSILLLENMRFFPGEQQHNIEWAERLHACAEWYVNDAFASLHNDDTSLTLLPRLFPQEKKTIGFLVEKELAALSRLRYNPNRPFLVILGGGKPAKKLPFLQHLLSLVDTVLLCPPLVFPFLKAQEKSIGASFIEEKAMPIAERILQSPLAKKILFPIDFQVAQNAPDGPLSYTLNPAIADHDVGIAIGPQTTDVYQHCIAQAQTILFNGPMGFADRPETMYATHQLLCAMAASPAYTVVGGGDSIAAAFNAHSADQINFLSTGGGATLAYVSGAALPALDSIFSQ